MHRIGSGRRNRRKRAGDGISLSVPRCHRGGGVRIGRGLFGISFATADGRRQGVGKRSWIFVFLSLALAGGERRIGSVAGNPFAFGADDRMRGQVSFEWIFVPLFVRAGLLWEVRSGKHRVTEPGRSFFPASCRGCDDPSFALCAFRRQRSLS